MILTYYDRIGYDRSSDVTRQATDEEKTCFDRIFDIVKKELMQLKLNAGDAASRQKFVDTLYNVSRHYPKIVSHFANGFIYSLKSAQMVSGEVCNLKMFTAL